MSNASTPLFDLPAREVDEGLIDEQLSVPVESLELNFDALDELGDDVKIEINEGRKGDSHANFSFPPQTV